MAEDKPLTLTCYCGFEAATPEAFADHCLLTKHVTDLGGTDDGELAGFITALGDMQRYVSGERPLPEGITITALSEADILNDEDLSDEDKAHLIDTARAIERKIAEGKDDEES